MVAEPKMTKLRQLANLFKLVIRDTRGVSAIEYVVLIAGVAVFIVLAWTLAGTQISNVFQEAASGLTGGSTSIVDNSDSGGASQTASSDNDDDSDFDDDSDS